MIPSGFRPLLAAKTPEEHEWEKLANFWPLMASPKLDGIRAVVLGGIVYSRTLKPIRSAFVQKMFGRAEYEGLDGELIYGHPTDEGCFNRTTSAVMTVGSDEPVHFWVFDHVSEHKFLDRANIVQLACLGNPYMREVPQVPVANMEQLLEYEKLVLHQGYEGAMIRNPQGLYKYGRSTLREGHLIKLKRFEDSEAIIEGFVEKMHNRNAPVIDALGLQKRSASLEGRIPAGVMGTIVVRDLKTGIQFEIGSGFDDSTRAIIWHNKERFKGRIVKYKHQPYGQVEKPRAPIFLGFRDLLDIGGVTNV